MPIRIKANGKEIDLYHIDQSDYNIKRFAQQDSAEVEIWDLYDTIDSLKIAILLHRTQLQTKDNLYDSTISSKNATIMLTESKLKLKEEECRSCLTALNDKGWLRKLMDYKIFGVRIDVLLMYSAGFTTGILLGTR